MPLCLIHSELLYLVHNTVACRLSPVAWEPFAVVIAMFGTLRLRVAYFALAGPASLAAQPVS